MSETGTDNSPRAVAERRLAAEDAEQRDQRLATLEREEQAKRDAIAARAEEKRRREAARAEADKLAVRRGELADELDMAASRLARLLEDYDALDGRQRAALARAGENVPSANGRLFEWFLLPKIGRWIGEGEHSFDPHGDAPLGERDPLVAKP